MKLYDELAEWWPVFSDPEEYRREAVHIGKVLRRSTRPAPHTVLELGSGGGNSAYHLKARFAMTLVDLSPRMLAVSRKLNPECEHIKGDIRRLRLGRTFDAVFVHDAIAHMTTERDLRAVMQTAYEHCRPGGVALFVPDFVSAASDSCSGSSTRTRATPPTWSTSRFSFATRKEMPASRMTATCWVCFRADDGCIFCAMSVSATRSSRTTRCVNSSSDIARHVGDSRDAIMRIPLTYVVRFEYHNELKSDALTVVITEATITKSSRTFSSNAFGTRQNDSSGPNTEKEVNQHGREEEGC
jgi:hypothetical protein